MIPADLLDQLREKDPELWGKINRVYAMRYMRQIDDPQILEFLTGKEKQALIQGYLQERIRARGWSYRLIWASSVDICKAFICTGPGIHESVNCDTEAEALGWAYLAAIEAIRP